MTRQRNDNLCERMANRFIWSILIGFLIWVLMKAYDNPMIIVGVLFWMFYMIEFSEAK